MRKNRTLAMSLITLLSLAGCGGEDEPLGYQTRLARTAAEIANVLLSGETILPRPASLLGTFIALYVSSLPASPHRSALRGIEAQISLLSARTREEGNAETLSLLETLGSALQVDIPDMLNRSADRRQALDTYLASLNALITRSTSHVEFLEQRREEIQGEARSVRNRVSTARRNVNTALRDEDYTSAASHQETLTQAESEYAVLSSREDEVRRHIDIFEELLEVANERVNAIDENRVILIAGLKVIDVPGITDIGVIDRMGRRRFGE